MVARGEETMATDAAVAHTSEPPEEAWARWEREHADVLERATKQQQVLLQAAVWFVAVIAGQPLLLRMAAFFLLHAGMGLTPAQVGAAVGRTDRAMRTVRGLSARDLLDAIWAELGRHRQPKLHPEHAGPIAKYLVDHPRCTLPEVVAFIGSDLRIEIDPQTLRRFLDTYGLDVFRPDPKAVQEAEEARPFRWGAPTSGAPSSCCPPRSP
jgi:transposase